MTSLGGVHFSEVISHHIEKSIFLAIRTDYYSSSEWCRREVIEAKRKGVPHGCCRLSPLS